MRGCRTIALVTALVTALAALAGCDDGSTDRLRREVRTAEARYATYARVLVNLDRYLQDAAALQRRFEELGASTPVADIRARLALAGAQVAERNQNDFTVLELTATGGAPRLLELAEAAADTHLLVAEAGFDAENARLLAVLQPRFEPAVIVPLTRPAGLELLTLPPFEEPSADLAGIRTKPALRQRLAEIDRRLVEVQTKMPGFLRFASEVVEEREVLSKQLAVRDQLLRAGVTADALRDLRTLLATPSPFASAQIRWQPSGAIAITGKLADAMAPEQVGEQLAATFEVELLEPAGDATHLILRPRAAPAAPAETR